MDKSKIALIGSIVIAVVVLAGAIYLTSKGQPLPAWLAGLVTAVGMVVATFVKPPGTPDQAKPDAPKDGAQ